MEKDETADLKFQAEEKKSEDVEIKPLKDFPQGIHQNNVHIDNIKKGEKVTIPRQFLQNMVTEGVIDKIPK
jgi:hypothetical protein